MDIRLVTDDRRTYMPLLLMADEQESMIERYLSCGEMFAAWDRGEVCAVCIVTDRGDGTAEIKNIAVVPERRGEGLGRTMVEFLERRYRGRYDTLVVGTGDSPATMPFYRKCGFEYSHRIPDFFTDNYDHPIVECGTVLRDMVYLKKHLRNMTIDITETTSFDPEVLDSVNRLLAQLTDRRTLDADDLRRIIEDDAAHLFLLRADGAVVGMSTLAVYRAPSGAKAWIEDVVVDDAMRGRSLGRMLLDHVVDYARRMSPVTLMLTSRPSRLAANALYRSVGFELKQTNVYKIRL